MSADKLIGYKVKRSVKVGQILKDNDILEEVYEPKTPLEELADLAYNYAHLRNDPELGTRIEKLVKEIEDPK